jgi:hypothetical protein
MSRPSSTGSTLPGTHRDGGHQCAHVEFLKQRGEVAGRRQAGAVHARQVEQQRQALAAGADGRARRGACGRCAGGGRHGRV